MNEAYDAHLGGEMGILRQKNGLFEGISIIKSKY
jgi:hypothetical protein